MKRLVPVFGFAFALLASADVRGANPPGALDLPPSNVVPAPVEVAPTGPPRAQQPADPAGNPLWAVPLSSLTATRERPIFLPSRRAPAPAVAGTPVVVAPPPPPAEPEQPPLTLVGVIAGDTEGFAVFLDPASNSAVRLKTGQDHQGWVLRSVKGREATLEKNKRSATLTLPAPTALSLEGTGPGPTAPPVPPMPTVPSGRPPRPGGASPNPQMPVGAPKQAIPGDPRPLQDQL
jgi:general secretion pathway protein N